MIGLIKAVKSFNPKLGNKFSTYAFYFARQEIVKYIAKNKNIIRTPEYIQAIESKLARGKKLTEFEKRHIKDKTYPVCSLNYPIRDRELGDFISHSKQNHSEFELELLLESLDNLTEREKRIIELKLQGRSFRYIAKRGKVTYQRIHQIFKEIILRLRRNCRII